MKGYISNVAIFGLLFPLANFRDSDREVAEEQDTHEGIKWSKVPVTIVATVSPVSLIAEVRPDLFCSY